MESFTKSETQFSTFKSGLIVFFGIIMPIIALGVELVTQMCADSFFDPLPTPIHILLIAFVPLANYLVWRDLMKGRSEHLPLLQLVNGITIGITLYYTLIFAPIIPIGIVAIIFVGMGLLPLAPLMALISAIVARRELRNLYDSEAKMPKLLLGCSIGFFSLILAALPSVITRVGMQMASSAEVATSNRGVKLLRSIGSNSEILNNCYQERRSMFDVISMLVSTGDPVTQEEARNIYYRVTGAAFNSVERPKYFKSDFFERNNRNDDFEWDSGLGGTSVSQHIKGLSLASSRQDQSIDGNAAVSYTEWTMVFKNASQLQREARAQISLPPGGVVSRLTLWVNGEEREAAFAGRSKVREAYNEVAIQQRRDPVLVTTSGIDRVLMQCFPVPPNGGEMKIRIGITSPLKVNNKDLAELPLPFLIEQNFGVSNDLKHSVWLESKQEIKTSLADLKAETNEGGKFLLRGNLENSKLSEGWISVSRNPDAVDSWTHDSIKNSPKIITQHFEELPVTAPARLIVVVDGSQQMREIQPQLAKSLAQLPGTIETKIILASDQVAELTQEFFKPTAEKISSMINEQSFAGGNDNLPALIKAWDVAVAKPNTAIVWLHGSQPVEMRNIDELRQRYERGAQPRLYDVQLSSGANRLAENLQGFGAVEVVPNRLTGLDRMLAQWNGTQKTFVAKREIKTGANQIAASETSSHLARLWANDEVGRMTSKHTDEAIKLASSYQLVTSVTGAVVLETQAQYERAGLDPVDSNSVPTIPEPETWALIMVVGAVLLFVLFRQRQSRCMEYKL